jgi:uncharacterized OB-fold protein
MSAEKIIGKPDDLNLELFQAIVATNAMHLQRCDNCGNYSHPPRMFCGSCFSGDYSYPEISGAGAVYSYEISRHTAEPAWQGEIPYLTVVVELDEGPRIVGAATLDDPTTVRIGQRVRVVPEKRTDDFAYFTVVFEDSGAS